ncbi:hypothetical protein [Rhizobium sullae]|uniref:Uncharacterized protein n=1 Tax=Rhizobium sullae TaxID=50338 RepID=A0ABY5XYY2_RHISU|nr:hypothetical protein [Rhizobium sullae]UWU19182.1 hypothetical protein N2599_35885 [Rhizobium sullae]
MQIRRRCRVSAIGVIDPGIYADQMMSGIIFGFSTAMGQATTLKDGRVVQANFDEFDAARMAQCPEIEHPGTFDSDRRCRRVLSPAIDSRIGERDPCRHGKAVAQGAIQSRILALHDGAGAGTNRHLERPQDISADRLAKAIAASTGALTST